MTRQKKIKPSPPVIPEPMQLTKTGQPRQRKPGAGRKSAGRTAVMPRILPGSKAVLDRLAVHWGCTLGEAIERAAVMAAAQVLPKSKDSAE